MNNRVARMRVCLKCQQQFFSRGPGNRICQRCNHENAGYRHISEARLAIERGRKYRNGERVNDP